MVMKTLHKKRCSVGVSLAGAVAALPFLLILPMLFLVVLYAALDSWFFPGWPVKAAFGVIAAITVTLVYAAVRTIYYCLRWRVVEADGRYCADCGYDLTGNTSGTCPECGVPIETRRASANTGEGGP